VAVAAQELAGGCKGVQEAVSSMNSSLVIRPQPRRRRRETCFSDHGSSSNRGSSAVNALDSATGLKIVSPQVSSCGLVRREFSF
jgi:hypothetical protein